ncbi:MAG: GNAT family N-acetyltransferase [Candidatus Thorarchaeota archaeon]
MTPIVLTSTTRDDRQIVVRTAEVSDARELHAGFCRVVEEGIWLPTLCVTSVVADWVAWINRTRYTREVLLRADVDGQYAGHLTLQPEEWAASSHVARLGVVVMKPFRNLGVGRALMIAAESAAREQKYEKIVLSTFSDNMAARHLYESLGYRMVGERRNHFRMPSGYIHETLYERELVEPQ